MHTVEFAGLRVGAGAPLLVIAGPCVIESEAHAIETAHQLREVTARAGVQFMFKASYDKANRTSIASFRGPGLAEGTRSIAFRLRFRASERTLTDEEVDRSVERVLRALKEEHGIERR